MQMQAVKVGHAVAQPMASIKPAPLQPINTSLQRHQGQAKVFGIGFHKTATTSLAAGLYILGYNVTGHFDTHNPDVAATIYQRAFELADRFDAVQDTPWPVLYQELDQRYPNSKFVLTIRPTEQWIKSVVKHFHYHHIPVHEWIYGVKRVTGNEDVYIARYEAHNREVMAYFQDRPDDLLVMDITRGDGWEKLCPFLGKPIPSLAFPAQNQINKVRKSFWQRGMGVMGRKLNALAGDPTNQQANNSIGVKALRDILHYHYGTTCRLWDAVDSLSDEQFTQAPAPWGDSLHSHLRKMAIEEYHCLQKLQGRPVQPEKLMQLNAGTKTEIYDVWHETQMALRHYTAYLTSELVHEKVGDQSLYAWELFIHIMNFGTTQRAQCQAILRTFGIAAHEESFSSFFHGAR